MPKIEKRNGKLKNCLGGVDYEDHKYMKNMNAQQRGRVNKVFGGSARYNETIVNNATKLADGMGIPPDPDKFMSLVEIVAAKTKQDPGFQWTDASLSKFQNDLTKDLGRVRHIANANNVNFSDEWKALYHYRKHGEEFMSQCTPKFYLKDVPSNIMRKRAGVKSGNSENNFIGESIALYWV
uniref:Uncharacterized protein n=1 Tax=Caenorhabditis japonica TaxID=281687 RepID=A0A8R1E6J5_CAEJA